MPITMGLNCLIYPAERSRKKEILSLDLSIIRLSHKRLPTLFFNLSSPFRCGPSVTNPMAPFEIHSSIKSWPSKFGPATGIKKSPFSRVLESVEIVLMNFACPELFVKSWTDWQQDHSNNFFRLIFFPIFNQCLTYFYFNRSLPPSIMAIIY